MLNKININALLKQVNLLNCILIGLILILAIFVLVPIFTADVTVPVYTPAAVSQPKTEPEKPATIPPLQDFIIISEKNLFHPGRILPAQKKEETIQRPEFILYGTLITDGLNIAYLSDNRTPRSTPGRGKRQTALKLGETMSGYMLKEVHFDRILMVRGDDSIEVKVISPGIKKNRGGDGAAPMATMPGVPMTSPPMALPSQPSNSSGGIIPPAATNNMRPERTPSRMPRTMIRP